jgi:transcriptional regulator with XRE-family HTH domain
MTLASRLTQLRTKDKLTVAELARRAGITRQTIYYIERGDNLNPKMETVIGLARALKVDAEKLIGSHVSRS